MIDAVNSLEWIDDEVVELAPEDCGEISAAIEAGRRADREGTVALVVDPGASADVDPFVVAAAIAVRTRSVWVGVAVPLAQWSPYAIARRLAELDKLSGGRIAWRPVDSEPQRSAEAVSIVSALLTSWGPGALTNDRVTGRHADAERIAPVTVSGRFFTIDSPLDVPPGPQGVVPVFGVAPGGSTPRTSALGASR